VTRVSAVVVLNRLGKAEEAPKRVWMGEGRKSTGARELAESPDDRTRIAERRRGHQSTRIPDLPKGRGNVEGNHQSSRRVVKRATARESFDGLRSAGVLRQAGWQCVADKRAKLATQREQRCVTSARAGHRSDWVLVRGSRFVEVDETCLSRHLRESA